MFIEEALSEPTITFQPLIEDWQSLTESYGEDYFFLSEDEKQGVLARIKAFVKKLYETIKGYVMKAIAWVKGLFSKKGSSDEKKKAAETAKEAASMVKKARAEVKKGNDAAAKKMAEAIIKKVDEQMTDAEKKILADAMADVKKEESPEAIETALEKIEAAVEAKVEEPVIRAAIECPYSREAIERMQNGLLGYMAMNFRRTGTDLGLVAEDLQEIQDLFKPGGARDVWHMSTHKDELGNSWAIQGVIRRATQDIEEATNEHLKRFKEAAEAATDPEEAKLAAEKVQAFSSAIRICSEACLKLTQVYKDFL